MVAWRSKARQQHPGRVVVVVVRECGAARAARGWDMLWAKAILVVCRGCRMVAGQLLVADRRGWRCFATVNAAWDCVGGQRLRQLYHGTTRLTSDLVGCSAWQGPPGEVQHQKMTQLTSLAC